jgi:hypothetical protein
MSIRYTVQSFADSGNWADPQGNEVRHYSNKREVNNDLGYWADVVEHHDDRRAAFLMVWCGEFEDVTDQYPDFKVTIGPRGGINWEPC